MEIVDVTWNFEMHIPNLSPEIKERIKSGENITLRITQCSGFVKNAEKWGLGGINIAASRIGNDQITTQLRDRTVWHGNQWGNGGYEKPIGESEPRSGRWPANLLLDEEAAEMLDQMTGNLGKSQGGKSGNEKAYGKWGQVNYYGNLKPGFGDSGGASRFFYTAKASASERQGSKHPTIKPKSLIKYIVKLLAPPGDPICLDPFMGSGTCGIVCKELGIRFIGIEKESQYFEDAKRRIDLADAPQYDLFDLSIGKSLTQS